MNKSPEIQKLKELIKDIRIAMLVTNEAGVLRSRPMGTQEMGDDGVLWFFTYKDSHKVDEVNNTSQVNICYQDPKEELYVSVSGDASIVNDRNKIDELWNPMLKAWFPKGKDDPNISLIKVNITQAEYWDAPNSTMVQIIGMAKAAITGSPYDAGENKKINL